MADAFGSNGKLKIAEDRLALEESFKSMETNCVPVKCPSGEIILPNGSCSLCSDPRTTADKDNTKCVPIQCS